jgi:hypothetical protein
MELRKWQWIAAGAAAAKVPCLKCALLDCDIFRFGDIVNALGKCPRLKL